MSTAYEENVYQVSYLYLWFENMLTQSWCFSSQFQDNHWVYINVRQAVTWPWSSRAWVQRCALLNNDALPEVHGHLQSDSPLFYTNRNICLHYYNRLLFTFQPFSPFRLSIRSIVTSFQTRCDKQATSVFSNLFKPTLWEKYYFSWIAFNNISCY